jgi:hypothetical protein
MYAWGAQVRAWRLRRFTDSGLQVLCTFNRDLRNVPLEEVVRFRRLVQVDALVKHTGDEEVPTLLRVAVGGGPADWEA